MPRFLEILISAVLPQDEYLEKAGDLEEVYYSIKSEKGKLNATVWILIQILLAFPGFIVNRIYWGNIMFRNYLTITSRIIRKYKTFSFINIFGLGTGLAVFILLGLFVKNEFSYEQHHKNLENIYRINTKYSGSGDNFTTMSTCVPIAEDLANNIPEIISFARFAKSRDVYVKKDNTMFPLDNYVFTDNGIFDLFTIELLEKKNSNPLEEINTVVISQKTARQFFGNENALGKYLEIEKGRRLTVTGIMEQPPQNSFMQYEVFISMKTLRSIVGERFFTNKISTQLRSYVMTTKNSDIKIVEKKAKDYLARNYYQDSNGDETVELEALKDIHLYSKVSDSGNFSIVLIFIAAGILILLIACINFMNLSTAKSLTRIKEIGIRKSTGANRTELIKQFLGESFIFSFFSMMLAVVLVGLLLPEFNELTGLKLTIGILFHLDNLLIIFAIWIITSLTAGSYPALYLSKFEPVDIMNGKIDRGAKAMAFRKLLVIVQFSIAIALIASTFIINDQLDYMINKDLGFNSNQVMVVRLKGRDIRKSLKSFKNELLANPEIKNVALSNRLPSLIGNYNIVSWENAAPDENISINFTDIEPDFIKTYDIKIIEGPQTLNEKSPGLYDGLLINETAAKRFGWKGNAVGKKVFQLYGNSVQEFKVLGVVKDFHYGSLRNDILPLKLRFKKGYFNYVSIKMATNNIEKNVEFVKQIWHKFDSKYPFNYFFMDEVFENRYKAEKNLREIFTYFSLLTLIVSCLGLLGLASFLATQKTKEIGIRKVLGASSNMIVFLLSKDFMKYVVISNLIAWPLAYFFMKNWLNEFAYKTSINPAVIVFAGVLALLTAFAAVGFQAYKASVANPVKSLRNE